MADLRSKPLIVAKGVMFLAIAALAAWLILDALPSWRIAALLAVLVWAACRFYYFLFYVLEQYVDPRLRYAGIWAMVAQMLKSRGRSMRAKPQG
jgi:hypothetical protein